MKKTKTLTLLLILSLILMTGCQNNSRQQVDLDRVLTIMSDTMSHFEQENQTVASTEAMNLFAEQFRNELNTANPKIHPQSIGVMAKTDGSFIGFNDKNSNNKKENGERELFTIEVDQQNNRLLASQGQYVREHRAGSGILTGMLIGSMLSGQRRAGVNTSNIGNKTASPKQSVKSRSQRSSTTSARSRSSSGSYSRGK